MHSSPPGSLRSLVPNAISVRPPGSHDAPPPKDHRVALITLACSVIVGAVVIVGLRSHHTSSATASGRPARLYLTSTVLQRLQQRAAAADPAWTALKTHCDGLATGTFNTPTQPAYPDFPNVGQGYEGDGYLPEVMNLGLCYRVESGVDDTSAALHGAAGARLLEAMATPVGSGGQDPSTDDGYGIRNYGVAMATGFDWLYPALSPANVADVVTSLNAWVSWFDAHGFANGEPVGNYFQGYLLAKTATAVGTQGDNPSSAADWGDVQTRMWGQLVQPHFSASMSGGGWPEGWEYGPRSVENYLQFLMAVKTGQALDWWSQVPNARDEAAYITYFAWPSRLHMDDQGMIHSQTRLAPPGVTMAYLSGMLEANADPYAATARSATAAFLTTNSDVFAPWEAFLYWDTSLPVADYTQQPLSYFASGPNQVAVRSSWSTSAVWGSFVSGTYIDAQDSGEQGFNQGSVVVVSGDQPILANASGWLPQANGADGENFVYADEWTNETRLLANTFYLAGTKQGTQDPTVASTHIQHYEEGGSYARARGVKLEDMYMTAGAVTQFTRDFVYVRPATFVVYDRTTVADGTADQWTAWHTPTAPAVVTTTDPTQTRYDISAGGGVVGSVRSLLPSNARSQIVTMVGTVSRLENHAATPASATDWLTVVTAGASVPAEVRLSMADGNVTGAAVGVHVLGPRNAVVLFSNDHAAAAQLGTVAYDVAQTATADHVLIDIAPSTNGYAVTATVSAATIAVEVKPGGVLQATPEGTLAFVVGLDGTVTARPPPSSGDASSAPAKGDATTRSTGMSSGSGGSAGSAGGAESGSSQPGSGARGAGGGGCAVSGRDPRQSDFGALLVAALFVCAGVRRSSPAHPATTRRLSNSSRASRSTRARVQPDVGKRGATR
jgi:hypothetical protein